MSKKKTHEEFMRDFKNKQPENFERIDILGEYEGSSKKIKCRCKIDGYEWEVTPDGLLHGSGCPKCAGTIKKTHEEFMENFKNKQPENFNKIEVLEKYININTKILCKCKVDGYEWEATPNKLLCGRGCPKCRGKIKRTHNEFIKEFKEKQPENFNKIEIIGEYKNNKIGLKCRCRVDRYEWLAVPDNLLKGSGCPKCSGNIKKTHEEFIKEFEKRNPEKFKKIEVLTKYETVNKKVLCKCKVDSYEWEVTPHVLLRGGGCPKCAGTIKKSHNEFIKEFEKKWPENFNKIEVLEKYKNIKTKLKCRCKIDGYEWEVTPDGLLHGSGCPKCAGTIKKTHEEFMENFKNKQPENFNKIEVLEKYINTNTKILCKCKVDGYEWKAHPSGLLRGKGCPECAKNQSSLFEQFIYEAFKEVVGENNVLHRDKSLIGKELDVYIKNFKIAFEPGNWYWHSEKTWNDYDKYLLCKEKGIKLITIYDGMKKDVGIKFEYDVVKYEKDITKEEMQKFVENQFKELKLENKINWDVIFKRAQTNCKKITHEEFIREFREKQPKNFEKIEVLGKYINSKEKIKCKCKIDGYEWEVIPHCLLIGQGCSKCIGRYKTHEEFLSEFKERCLENFEKIEILGRYEKALDKIKCKCKIDKFEWYTTPSNLLCGRGCPKCGGTVKKTHEEFVKYFKEKQPENFKKTKLISEYKGVKEKIKCKCIIDGCEWDVLPNNLLKGNNCPECAKKKRTETRRKNAELKKIQEQKEKEEKEN